MKKHTRFGKGLFWIGFFLFILGFAFNARLGIITGGPVIFSTISLPAIIVGILLLVSSNFFTKKNDRPAF